MSWGVCRELVHNLVVFKKAMKKNGPLCHTIWFSPMPLHICAHFLHNKCQEWEGSKKEGIVSEWQPLEVCSQRTTVVDSTAKWWWWSLQVYSIMHYYLYPHYPHASQHTEKRNVPLPLADPYDIHPSIQSTLKSLGFHGRYSMRNKRGEGA